MSDIVRANSTLGHRESINKDDAEILGFMRELETKKHADDMLARYAQERDNERIEFIARAKESNLQRFRDSDKLLPPGSEPQSRLALIPKIALGMAHAVVGQPYDLGFKFTEEEANERAQSDAEQSWDWYQKTQALGDVNGPSEEQTAAIDAEQGAKPATGPAEVAVGAFGGGAVSKANALTGSMLSALRPAAIRQGVISSGATVATATNLPYVDEISEDHPFVALGIDLALGITEGVVLEKAFHRVLTKSNSLSKRFTNLFNSKASKPDLKSIKADLENGDLSSAETRAVAREVVAEKKAQATDEELPKLRQAEEAIEKAEAAAAGNADLPEVSKTRVELESDGTVVSTASIKQDIDNISAEIAKVESDLAKGIDSTTPALGPSKTDITGKESGITTEDLEADLAALTAKRNEQTAKLQRTRSKNKPKLFDPAKVKTEADARQVISKVFKDIEKHGRYPFELENKTITYKRKDITDDTLDAVLSIPAGKKGGISKSAMKQLVKTLGFEKVSEFRKALPTLLQDPASRSSILQIAQIDSFKTDTLSDADFLRLAKITGAPLDSEFKIPLDDVGDIEALKKQDQLDQAAKYLQKVLGTESRSYAKNNHHVKVLATLDTLRAEADRLKGTPFEGWAKRLYVMATDMAGKKNTLKELSQMEQSELRLQGWKEVQEFQQGPADEFARDFPGDNRTGVTEYTPENRNPRVNAENQVAKQAGLSIGEEAPLPKKALSLEEEVLIAKQVTQVLDAWKTRVNDPFVSLLDGTPKFNLVRVNTEGDIGTTIKAFEQFRDYSKVTANETKLAQDELVQALGPEIKAILSGPETVKAADFLAAAQQATHNLAERAAKEGATKLDEIAFKKQVAMTNVVMDKLLGRQSTQIGQTNLAVFKSYNLEAQDDLSFINRVTEIAELDKSGRSLEYTKAEAEMLNTLPEGEQLKFVRKRSELTSEGMIQEASSPKSKDIIYLETKIKENADGIRTIVRRKCAG